MSFMVVMNGPVARAGSTLTLFRKRGIRVPKRAANMITTTAATETDTLSPSYFDKRDELTVKVRARFLLTKKL